MNQNIKSNYEKFHSKIGSNNSEIKEKGIREIDTIVKLSKYYFSQSDFIRNLDSSNKSVIKLMDIGCGNRYLSYGCEKFNISYEGIDYSDCNLEKDNIPKEDKKYDLVTSLALIEHLRDPSNFLSESYRILKPGGIFFISTPNWQYCFRDFFNDPTHIHPYTPISLKQVLEFSSFINIKIVPNLRCKSKGAYQGIKPFFRAAFLRPFTNNKKYFFIPKFLKGKALGLFGIGIKPF